MPVETVRVELLGTSFSIQTDESRDYVESLIAYLASKVDTVRTSSKVDDPLKAVILAGIFLVDELYRERMQPVQGGQTGTPAGPAPAAQSDVDLEALADRLIARMDETLHTDV